MRVSLILIGLMISSCTPQHEKTRLQEKLRCLDEVTAMTTGALDLLQYQLSNKFLGEDDFTTSVSYIQFVNKNATDECEAK